MGQALGKDPDDSKGRSWKPREKNETKQQPAPKPRAEPKKRQAPPPKRPAPPTWQDEEEEAPSAMLAAPVADSTDMGDTLFEYEEDESEFADTSTSKTPAPPVGTKVIRVHAAGEKKKPVSQKQVPKAPAGFKPIRTP